MTKFDNFNAEDRIDIKLLENHVYYLSGEIENSNIDQCIKWIMYENLDSKESKTLTLYINSPGGDLCSAFALIDIMKSSTLPIRTIAIGSVMSAAFLIFAAGTKGERYVSKHTCLMCHQFSEITEGKYHDIIASIRGNEICNQLMVNILSEATGLTPAKVRSKLLPASDVYLTAAEAVKLNIADRIL